jgi:hypothetical protein
MRGGHLAAAARRFCCRSLFTMPVSQVAQRSRYLAGTLVSGELLAPEICHQGLVLVSCSTGMPRGGLQSEGRWPEVYQERVLLSNSLGDRLRKAFRLRCKPPPAGGHWTECNAAVNCASSSRLTSVVALSCGGFSSLPAASGSLAPILSENTAIKVRRLSSASPSSLLRGFQGHFCLRPSRAARSVGSIWEGMAVSNCKA